MQPPTPSTRSLAIAALAGVAVLCIVSLGESFKALTTVSLLAGRAIDDHQHGKRNWETELSPFSGPPDNINDRMDEQAQAENEDDHKRPDKGEQDQTSITDDGKFGIPIATPLSIVACWFGHHCSSSTAVPGGPTQTAAPAPTDTSGGGIFGTVLSILAGGSPTGTPAPGSPAATNNPLGGLLSALSQAAPSPDITAPPIATPGSGGGGPGALSVLGGVASALDGVLGTSDGTNTGGGNGLLGQLSANILNPLGALTADPAAILANPTGVIGNLQSQVSAVLGGMPSAMAAGMQIASNVGGDLADALNATTDLLDSNPAVAGGVANQVGSLLNAGPALATGLPAAAMAAVDKVGGILNGIPGLGSAVTGLLAGMKSDLSNAASNADPQVSAMAAVVQSQVAGILPSGLQTLVAAAISSQQAGAAPQAGQLSSLLSSLTSSMATAVPAPTDDPAADSVANSALSGLSTLMAKISQLSLTASSTPPPSASTSSPNVAQTTIYYVQTITALMTSTAVQTSVMTFCPSAFSSYVPPAYPSAYPGLGNSGGSGSGGSGSGGSGGSGTDGSETGPCPGMGYTCSDCLDGWFCPPSQTPAAQVPCGYGWPCYHCQGGWFCVPEPQNAAPAAPVPAIMPAHAHSTTAKHIAAIPTAHPPANGYHYAGCYRDSPERALRDAQLLNAAGGMTNGRCVDFCRTQGFAIAGTEDGSQCFCGMLLLDSLPLDNGQCNMSCVGDGANATMCGGAWSLSVWTIDGSLQQAKSPKRDSALATVPDWQDISGVKSKFNAATAVYAWPLPTPTAFEPESLAAMNTSNLESAILAAVAAEASGLAFEPASASGIIESVSIILNMGMSSIAHDLAMAFPTSNAALAPEATGFQLGGSPSIPFKTFGTAAPGTFPVTAAPGMPTAYQGEADSLGSDSAAEAQDMAGGEGLADEDDDEGSYVFPTLPGVTTPGVTRGRRAPRRWAGWV